MAEDSRMHILQMIEEGKITSADGLRLLNALSAKPEPSEPAAAAQRVDVIPAATPPNAEKSPPPDFKKWSNWWLIPLYIGLVITLFGGGLMYWAYLAASGFSFWFVLACLPFAFGVVVMALAFASRQAMWIHLRVDRSRAVATGDDGPRKIAISLPVPFGIVAWFFRTFGERIPKLREKGLDEMVPALMNEISAENPLFLDVDDDDAHVQIYIG